MVLRPAPDARRGRRVAGGRSHDRVQQDGVGVRKVEEDGAARRLAPGLKFPILLDPDDIVQKRLRIRHPDGVCPKRSLYVVAPGRAILLKQQLAAMKPADVARLAEL